MIWSQLKKRVEAFFVPELSGRVELRSTNYRKAHDQEGRGYITVDGKEIWGMATHTFWKEERKRINTLVAETKVSPAEAQQEVWPTLDRDGWPGLGFADTMIGLKWRSERMVPHGRATAEVPA